MSQELLWFYVVNVLVSLHCFEINVIVRKHNLFSKLTVPLKGALSKLPQVYETKRTLLTKDDKALAAEDSCTLDKVLSRGCTERRR